ncbi:hypothetical protein [Lentzea sp. NPDC004782]|uniref:hypothetical protein n=1 Tax=Lentzea sp. NPDC004782 TaxID=3154458 RepID=UPI0033A7675B
MLVNECVERGHQPRNLLPHDRKCRLRIAFGRDSGHELKVIIEALTQLGEQDQIAHR